MNAEDLTFHNGSNTKVIKHLGAVFPWISVSVFSNGFVIEAIDGGDLPSLVVSSKKCDVSWVFKFQTQQKLECLY